MKQDDRSLFDRATHALRSDVPDSEAITAAASRAAQTLGIEMNHEAWSGAIQTCEDVRQLMTPFRAGTLPEARALLVQAHMRECGSCLRSFHEQSPVDWTAPRRAASPRLRPQSWGWALAFSCALLISALFLYKAYWQVPPGVRAEVQSIDGTAFLISGSSNRQLSPGTELREGDQVRTAGQSHAILRLSDGSLVEMDQRSTLGVNARGHNTTVALDQGALIVQAAHRTSGHLYVRTWDCRVAVTGTVFSVNSGMKGSRVAVLRGSVDVAHSGVHASLHPGDQLATSDSLAPEPLAEQFTWSADRQEYVGIMAQLANVEHRIAQIPFPESRFSSSLLSKVPANTLLYISIPNLGDFVNQANTIFQDQLNQSPELQRWWTRGGKHNSGDLNALVEKIHDVSQYLGDEIVIAGTGEENHHGGVVLAPVQRSGLADELRRQFSTSTGGLVVLDEASLATTADSYNSGPGGYALVREHEVVFSNSIAALKLFAGQLNAGDSGFAASDFGKQISAAYERGAGIILAANLHAMLQNGVVHVPRGANKIHSLENSGLGDVQYLIAEHREANGLPQNHLNLQFAGTRQRVASWLASPAPIGSLDFVSPNAAVAVAALSKDPAAIADDIIELASQSRGTPTDWSEIDDKLEISVRNDLAANLGGDFLLALDGPVLPTPAWKLVVEVNNADHLENTLERLAKTLSNLGSGANQHQITIEPSTVGSQRYYAIRDLSSGLVKVNYTFVDGFLVVAPERALLIDALQIHASGNSLARSASFRSLLPHDQNENYSAIAYQNLSPVLTPLLSQFSGESADAIRRLAADSRPTVICAWGKDKGIEAASDSRLFGFDFLTMGAILNSRNKSASQSVIE